MNQEMRDPERETARVIEGWLHRGVQALPDGDSMPRAVMSRVLTDIEGSPRQMGRRHWFGLGRHPLAAVGSLAMVVLLALGTATALPLLEDRSVLRVAQDGSGEFTTLAEAIASAHDGDTVLLAPGTYTEAIEIDRDITVRGDGDREDVVITAPEDGPTAAVSLEAQVTELDAYAVLLRNAGATLEDLTFRGGHSSVHVSGGSPTLRRLTFDDVGRPYVTFGHARDTLINAIVINGDSVASVVDNRIIGGGAISIWDDAAPTVLRNEMIGSTGIFGGGRGSVIRDNVLRGSRIWIHADPGAMSHATIEHNEFVDAPLEAILITYESTATITGNDIHGATVGISVQSKLPVIIEGNRLVGNESAVVLKGSDPVIRDNTIRGNGSGIFVAGGSPVISDNTVRGGTVGLGLADPRATPILSGNIICGNTTNVSATFGAEMPDTTGNEVCADEQELASQ